MARRKSATPVANPADEAIVSPEKLTQERGIRLWTDAAKRLRGSRDRMKDAEDVTLGVTQLVPPKWLTTSTPGVEYLVPRLPQRKSLVLNMTQTIMETRPYVERKRPPKGGPTSESRAEETETALNALLLDLFPWKKSVGRSVQHAEYAVVTLLAEDAWDAKDEYDDVLTEAEWKELPKKEQQTYRRAEVKDGSASYKRPKRVYWRDKDGRGVENDDYGRRDPKQTRKAYEDALQDYCAQHPVFDIRGYSAFDAVPTFDATGLVALSIRQLMEPSALLARGYRCQGLDLGPNDEPRVMIPRGFDAQLWGEGERVYLYQHFLWIDGDPHVAYQVGGQATWIDQDDERIEAVFNLRETWGFSRLPCGYYYGPELATDDPNDAGVPFMDPIGETLVAAEGLIGSINITAWRRGTGKYVVTPAQNVPPDAYLDAANNLKPIDIDPNHDIVTVPGPVGTLAPLESSGDTKWLVPQLLGAVQEATPAGAAYGQGEGVDSGREASLLHTYAMSAQSMVREGLRQAYEDAASFMLEWACCYMRTKKLDEIPYYANVEADPQEGNDQQGEKTVIVRLREDWIGRNYKISSKYAETYNPVKVQQMADLAGGGFATSEDVWDAMGVTNHLRQRIRMINDAYWKSQRGQAELSAIEARQRGDLDRARGYEAWLANDAAALQADQQGNPTQLAPAAALDPMFQPQQSASGGGPTTAQSMTAGTVGAGRSAALSDAATTAGVQAPVGAGGGM